VLQFDLNRNIDAAARDVQAAINAARSQLPPNLPNNPTYRKVNPADAPIMILAMTSDVMAHRPDLRRGRLDPRPEALPGGGRGTGVRGRRRQARRARAGRSRSAERAGLWPGGRAGGAAKRERQLSQGGALRSHHRVDHQTPPTSSWRLSSTGP
jgi:hypothetical protein